MKATNEKNITVSTSINRPIHKVWEYWTQPHHIMQWNHASEDWHTPKAQNDLRVGGKFNYHMEAKDGSMGFDFEGIYDEVMEHQKIAYTLGDGRKAVITFSGNENETQLAETFDPDQDVSIDLQKEGWQSILNNFKKYAEMSGEMVRMNFEISIDAPVENVYWAMLDKKIYAEWTAVFNASSYFKGSWEKGAKILFLGTDENGNEGGMVSEIVENIPYHYVGIKHIGVVENGEEITSGPAVEDWAGSRENYIFEDENGSTRLRVELDTSAAFSSYMEEVYPKALRVLKSICEKR